MANILSNLDKKEENIIIMGDFNNNLFIDNKQRSAFEEAILCNGFTPTISVGTHATGSHPPYQLVLTQRVHTHHISWYSRNGFTPTISVGTHATGSHPPYQLVLTQRVHTHHISWYSRNGFTPTISVGTHATGSHPPYQLVLTQRVHTHHISWYSRKTKL